jgi:hypothetical protein
MGKEILMVAAVVVAVVGVWAVYQLRRWLLWLAMQQELELSAPEIGSALPSVYEGHEVGDGLLNTERDYFEQVESYKLFQGRD